MAANNPDVRPNLASSLSNLGSSLSGLGDCKGALAAIRESVDIRRALAAENSDAFRLDLARSLNNLGVCLCGLGDHTEALVVTRESVDIYRALAVDNPGAFQSALDRSLSHLRCHGGIPVSRNQQDEVRAQAVKSFALSYRMALHDMAATLRDVTTDMMKVFERAATRQGMEKRHG